MTRSKETVRMRLKLLCDCFETFEIHALYIGIITVDEISWKIRKKNPTFF